MPIHDWTRVPAGTYHFFHQRWIQDIADALNGGGLPAGYFAMSEVDAKGPIPDVLALKAQPPMPPFGPAGVAVLDAPPRMNIGVSSYFVLTREYWCQPLMPPAAPRNHEITAHLVYFRSSGRPLFQSRSYFALTREPPKNELTPIFIFYRRFGEESSDGREGDNAFSNYSIW